MIRSSHLPGILGVSSKGECAVKESIVPPVQCEDTATVHTAKFKISAIHIRRYMYMHAHTPATHRLYVISQIRQSAILHAHIQVQV